MCSVCLGTVLLKDEELARYLEYCKEQLLLAVVTLILLGLDNYQTGVDWLPSVLWHCWLGSRKGIRPVKNGGWWRWALVSLDGVVPSRMVGVCLPLLIFPCSIKSRSSLLAPAHLGGPGKRAVKRLWCGVDQFCLVSWHHHRLWLNIDDVRKDFAVKFFCLLQQLRTVSYYVGCCVNIFSSANYIMLTSLDKYCFDYNFQWLNLGWQFESCVAVCSRSSWEWRFIEDIFHKVG